MPILPDSTLPCHRGTDENPSISRDFSGRIPQPLHLAARVVLDWVRTPPELDEPDAPPAVRAIWLALDRSCKQYRQFGTWKSDATIAQETGYGESTVTTTYRYLERIGFIARQRVMIDGAWEWMKWCLWTFSPLVGRDAAPVAGPMGTSIAVQPPAPIVRKIRRPKASPPTATAIFCDHPTENPAPETPQFSGDNLNQGFNSTNVNVNAADARGDGEPTTSGAEPATQLVGDQVVAEVTSPAQPTEVEVEAALVEARKFALVPGLARDAARIIRAAGREAELPPKIRAYKYPEPAPAEVPAPSASAVEAGVPPVADLKSLKTETLINRLIRRDDPAREEIVGIVAGRMAWNWYDNGSIAGFKSRLRMVGPKKKTDLSARRVLNAYLAADRYDAEKKGALFISLLAADVERIRSAGA